MFGEGNGTPLQYSCLENPMEWGAWWATVDGVTKSWTWLSDFPFTFHFHALEKEMATHSSVLAWRIPGTGEPGGLLSMGSHKVGHNWSDLVAAAATPCLHCFRYQRHLICVSKWSLKDVEPNMFKIIFKFLHSQKLLTVFLIIVNGNFIPSFASRKKKMPSSLLTFSHIPHPNPSANTVACVFKYTQTLLWAPLTASSITTKIISPPSPTLYYCKGLLVSLPLSFPPSRSQIAASKICKPWSEVKWSEGHSVMSDSLRSHGLSMEFPRPEYWSG